MHVISLTFEKPKGLILCELRGPFSSLTFCRDKHVVGGKVFYKHTVLIFI